jgi:hypothetical protein
MFVWLFNIHNRASVQDIPSGISGEDGRADEITWTNFKFTFSGPWLLFRTFWI